MSARTPEDIHVTIQYLRCVRRVAKKATISSVVFACQLARPQETARFPTGQTLVTLFIEFYYNFVEKIQIGLIPDTIKWHFKCDLEIIVNDDQQDATILAYLFIPSQLCMFRAMFSPIIRSTFLYLQPLILSTDIAAGWYHG